MDPETRKTKTHVKFKQILYIEFFHLKVIFNFQAAFYFLLTPFFFNKAKALLVYRKQQLTPCTAYTIIAI